MEGVNNIMANLTPNQKAFVKVANEQGFTSKITRKDCISLKENHGVQWPTWLVKNTAYRVGRGSYTLPTLGQVTESDNTDKSE
tara:strand:- start:255 stop:503 length:249 start_codon:yes stop_codon:yes gene_type:complete